MKNIRIKAGALSILAALVVSLLPVIDAEAQTRRRTAARRPAGTNTAIIPAGTELRVRLDNRLSSKDSRAGDRFTGTVAGPSEYEGSRVFGHVGTIRKSGRVEGRTSMSLIFDRIETSTGRRGVMRGEVIRVYDPGDESEKKVDEEGSVESGSRGKQTLKRSGIGAAAGAVLGGILGGGKGAVVGLIVGGAAGAGSIAIEGSKELELESGTEMLVRVTRR
ncbi:MAG TPA: hypothetical protein VIG62_09250 [Blastocatellia bacterium]|jgi:hypothetical protein